MELPKTAIRANLAINRRLDWLRSTAIRALYYELVCAPKPGLVTLNCSGSHEDMNAETFFRSLFSQRAYYLHAARAGADGASFEQLKALGIAAEHRMLAATGGVNTHRGALFSLGLLVAAAGRLIAAQQPPRVDAVTTLVRETWGKSILETRHGAPASPGIRVFDSYGAGGARAEAAAGFPSIVFQVFPAFVAVLEAGLPPRIASVQALFTSIAILEDTNLLHRGGPDGLGFAHRAARNFLAGGGVFRQGWEARAEVVANAFVQRRLSPGGSADALAITLFLWQLEHGKECLQWG